MGIMRFNCPVKKVNALFWGGGCRVQKIFGEKFEGVMSYNI